MKIINFKGKLFPYIEWNEIFFFFVGNSLKDIFNEENSYVEIDKQLHFCNCAGIKNNFLCWKN